MTKKIQAISASPEAIVYIPLKLPAEVSASAGDSLSEELSKLILLEAQGEAVEVSEEYPLPILMAAFDVVHKVSPEMVLRLKNGKRILLFDHWDKPVLRDEDIIELDEIEEIKHEDPEKFVLDLTIDLENAWKENGVEETDLEAVKNALGKIKKSIKPSITATLIGKAPVLLSLITEHLLYGKTGEIWYQENLSSKPIRITRL